MNAYVLTEDDINDIADHVAGRDPRAMHTPNGSVAALIEMLREARGECDHLRDERDAHRQHQRDAERALIMLLARSGGTVKFTPAEQISAPSGGSFVSTHEVGTGNMVLGFVPAKRYSRQEIQW